MNIYKLQKGNENYVKSLEEALVDYYGEKFKKDDKSTTTKLVFTVEGIANGSVIQMTYNPISTSMEVDGDFQTIASRSNYNVVGINLVLSDKLIFLSIDESGTGYGGATHIIMATTEDGKAVGVGTAEKVSELTHAKTIIEGVDSTVDLVLLGLAVQYQTSEGEILQVPFKIASPDKVYGIKDLFSVSLIQGEDTLGKDYFITKGLMDQKRSSKSKALISSLLYKEVK